MVQRSGQRDPSSCKQRALRIELVEAAIIAYYGTVQLPAEEIERLRKFLGQELDKLRSESDHERSVQARRLRKFQGEREKLLQAHYADAIPLELLKSEQDRITTAIAGAEGRLAAIAADFKTAEMNLHRALARAGDCQAAYRDATDRMRRQFNLAFFKRLIISDEGTVSGELAEPWDVILGEELRRAVAVREAESLTDAIEQAERAKERRPHEPESVLVGATPAATDSGDGWSPNILVRATQVPSNQDSGAPGNLVAEVTKVLASADQSRLRYVAKKLARLRRSDAPPRAIKSQRQRDRRPGWVIDAVVRVLTDEGRAMRSTHVRAAVESLLGHTVSKDSVDSCLSKGARGKAPRFERVAYGCYRLIRSS